LVRQTRYHEGRGYLTLGPIAEDSAAQRAGRAGRTAPGVCYRLWSPQGQLAPVTAPEIHRESLVPLVLTTAAWGERAEDLPWLDPPKPYALDAARAELRAWGALDGEAALSTSGRGLFALPIDPAHGRLLLEARRHDCLADMIDLVAVLSVGRPLFGSAMQGEVHDDGVLARGCDAAAAIAALRSDHADSARVSDFVLREAKLARLRLCRMEGLSGDSPAERPIDRDALVRAAIAADPRLAPVARRRGRDLFFSNGGTELQLARESAANHVPNLDAVIALDTRAFGAGREARLLITCAMPIPLTAIARAGLGRDRIAAVRIEGNRAVADVERVYAKRVIAVREDTPKGSLARTAVLELLTRGSLFKQAVATTRTRLARAALAAKLDARARPAAPANQTPAAAQSLEAWLLARLETLGVESGDDLALLSASDFIAPDLPPEVRSALDHAYPATVHVGDASYRADYDVDRDQVMLHMTKGSRRDPPPLAFLPKFPGLRICVTGPRGMSVVRERG
jgi:ATP-dependent helicase HrpB